MKTPKTISQGSINPRSPHTHRGSAALLAASVGILAIFSQEELSASTWTATATTATTWDSTSAPVGWTVGGVPNATGATGTYAGSVATTTVQNGTGTRTVGSLTLGSGATNSWTFTPTNTIVFDQDDAGTGTALISNASTNAATTNFMSFGTGTLMLSDDLTISNTGASTNASGAIQIVSTITGTGNLTLSSVANTVASSASYPGAIRLQTGVNTFTGNVLLQKGAATFNKAESFGAVATNVITLGQSGQGSVTLEMTAGVTVVNNIVAASGTGGTSVLGSVSTGSGTYSGTVTLNGDLTLNSASTGTSMLTLSNTVSGVGALAVTGTTVALSGANTYTGDTTVSSVSTLIVKNTAALQSSTLNYTTGTLAFDKAVTSHAFTFGNLTGSANIALLDNNTTPSPVALSVGNNNKSPAAYTGVLSGAGSLTKIGTGTLTLSNASTLTGATTVSSGTLLFSTGSINASNTVQVTGGALTLQNATALSDNGSLILSSGTTLNLDAMGGTETISYLYINGVVEPAGVYSRDALAALENPGDNVTFESLNGETLTVTVPEPTTVLGGALMIGAAAWSQRRRLLAAFTA